MKNIFFLRDEFETYLKEVENLKIDSAKSYCSYVAAVDNAFIIRKQGSDIELNLSEAVEMKFNEGDSLEMGHQIVTIINELSRENIEVELNTPICSIQKWRSALNKYYDFLAVKIEENVTYDDVEIENSNPENIEDENDEILVLNFDRIVLDGKNTPIKYKFSKSDLYVNFYFRLTTQDRFYNGIYYPISFIKRFLISKGERTYFDNWVNNLIDNVKVHIENDTLKLSQITELNIIDKKIYITHNELSKMALTKNADNITHS